jgi:hypothetical protein
MLLVRIQYDPPKKPVNPLFTGFLVFGGIKFTLYL